MQIGVVHTGMKDDRGEKSCYRDYVRCIVGFLCDQVVRSIAQSVASQGDSQGGMTRLRRLKEGGLEMREISEYWEQVVK